MTKPLRSDDRLTKTSHREARATCEDCGREWRTANALGMASIHARSHGHRVRAWAHLEVTYDGGAS
jgi:hypothetical protein